MDAESDVGRRCGGMVVRRRTRALASVCEAVRGADAPSRRAASFSLLLAVPSRLATGKATRLVRLGMQQRASSSGLFGCVANVVALRLRCRDMPSCPVFRRNRPAPPCTSFPSARPEDATVLEFAVVRFRAATAARAFEARGGGAHQFCERRLAFLHRASRRTLKEDPMVLCRRSRAKTRLLKQP